MIYGFFGYHGPIVILKELNLTDNYPISFTKTYVLIPSRLSKKVSKA